MLRGFRGLKYNPVIAMSAFAPRKKSYPILIANLIFEKGYLEDKKISLEATSNDL